MSRRPRQTLVPSSFVPERGNVNGKPQCIKTDHNKSNGTIETINYRRTSSIFSSLFRRLFLFFQDPLLKEKSGVGMINAPGGQLEFQRYGVVPFKS